MVFRSAGVGMHLPSPGWLGSLLANRIAGVIGAVSCSECAGWARSAARGCRAAVRLWVTWRGIVQRGTRVGTESDYTTIGMGAHVCPCCAEKTRQYWQVMSDIRIVMSRMFGPEHQQSIATLTSDFSTTTNPIKTIQKPMCSKLSLVSYEPSSLLNIFKS